MTQKVGHRDIFLFAYYLVICCHCYIKHLGFGQFKYLSVILQMLVYFPPTPKVEELKETVKEEFMPWVSQYLVMKRVSIEPNFHSLYSNFLDTLKNPEFVKMVLNETYRNIKVCDYSVKQHLWKMCKLISHLRELLKH